eukprot:PhF_6_TR31458/c0_g1_i3/m.46170
MFTFPLRHQTLTKYTEDPRTRLALIDLPPAVSTALTAPLKGSTHLQFNNVLIHGYFDNVKKFNKSGKITLRSILLTSDDMIVFENSVAHRFIRVDIIKELLLSQDGRTFAVSMVPGSNEHDLCFQSQHATLIIFILRVIFRRRTGVDLELKTDIDLSPVGQLRVLRMMKASNWVLHQLPLPTTDDIVVWQKEADAWLARLKECQLANSSVNFSPQKWLDILMQFIIYVEEEMMVKEEMLRRSVVMTIVDMTSKNPTTTTTATSLPTTMDDTLL